MSKQQPEGRPIFNPKEFSIEYDQKYEKGIKQKDQLKRKRSHN